MRAGAIPGFMFLQQKSQITLFSVRYFYASLIIRYIPNIKCYWEHIVIEGGISLAHVLSSKKKFDVTGNQ